jgi:hypothetical protein
MGLVGVQRLRDQAGLVTLLEVEELPDEEREAFEDMLLWVEKRPLTPKQRWWLNKVLRRNDLEEVEGVEDDGAPIPTRLTAGDVPRGREVDLLVKDKPLKPPTRLSKS